MKLAAAVGYGPVNAIPSNSNVDSFSSLKENDDEDLYQKSAERVNEKENRYSQKWGSLNK